MRFQIPRRITSSARVIVYLILMFRISWVGWDFAQAQDMSSRVAEPEPGSVLVEKDISPSGELTAGNEVEVTIALRGELPEWCYGIPGKPIDGVLLIDNSPSAFREGRWEKVQQSATSLITQLDQDIYADRHAGPLRSNLSVVVSEIVTNTLESRLVGPHQDYGQLVQVIEELGPGTDTVLEDSMPFALEALASPQPGVEPAIFIFLHDNGAFTTAGQMAVAEALQAGIDVYILAIGEEEEIDLARAVEMVGDAENVILNPSNEELRKIFVQATDGRGDLAALDVEVVEIISPIDLVDVIGVDQGGRIQDGKVVWQLDQLIRTEPEELTYRIRARGDGTVRLLTGIAHIDCNGFLHRYVLEEGDLEPLRTQAELQVGPAPTDTPAPSPPPTDSPAPVATSPSELVPSPSPTQDDTTGPIVTSARKPCVIRISQVIAVPCWILIPLALLLVLLALAIWYLLRRLRQPSRPSVPRAAPVSREIVQEPKRIGTTIKPGGEELRPGQIPDDSELLAQLRSADSFKGYVAAGQEGHQRSEVAVEVFRSPQDLASSPALKLENMGKTFIWQRPSGEIQVPIHLLEQVLGEKTTTDQPLLAVWSQRPTDNARIEVRVRPVSTREATRIQVAWAYARPAQVRATPPPLRYYLDLRLLNQPRGVLETTIVELESSE